MPVFYGARTEVDRPVPNGAIFIADAAHGGHDSHDGTSGAPLLNWATAMARVPAGGTITAYGGTWLASLATPRQKPFRIMSVPGERATITGRQPVTAWSPVGTGIWSTPWAAVIPHEVPTPLIVDPAHPWAPWPLMVWADGHRLERVGSLAEMQGQPRFVHDEANGVLYVGSDPTAAELTVGTLERGFVGSQDGNPRVDLFGLTFDGFVTRPMWLAAVSIHAPETIVQDCEFKRCAASGLFVNQVAGVTIDHATMFDNGQLGGRAYRAEDLEIGYSYLALNNAARFRTDQAAGAFKADTESHGGRVHHNRLSHNIGHGFWFDITSHDLDAWRNVGLGGHSLVYAETDKRACIAGNWAEDMLVGTYASGSREVERWCNTYVDCQQDERTQTDSRAESEFGFEHDDYRSFNAMHVRNDVDTGAAMLVWHDTHGGNRRTVADVHFTSEGGRYYRRTPQCGSVGRITMGLGVLRNFATLDEMTSATGLEYTGLEHVGPENPFMDPATGRATGQAKGQGVPLTAHVRALLELSAEEAANPDAGWYGAEYTPPPTEPEDPDMPTPYDTAPLEGDLTDLNESVTEIIAEVRRLEGELVTVTASEAAALAEVARLQAIIDADNDDEVIAQLQATVAQLQTDLAASQALANEHAVGRYLLALQVNALNAQLAALTAENAAVHADLVTRTAERDAAIVERDQALADLAECEAGDPELDPIIIGSSFQQGYPALKTHLGGPPDAFRLFVGAPRVTATSLTTMGTVQGDGAIPYVSVTKPSTITVAQAQSDAQYNADQIIAAGRADLAGVIIPIHEPTQKISGPDFKLVVTAALPIYRDALPNWRRLLCFMREDFLNPGTPRDPAIYLPDDLSLIDAIAVDLYDKGNADASGNGKAFSWLMQEVEAFAIARNLQIDVLECSAPDQGQRPGSPPVANPRRMDWKADFTLDAWDHMVSRFLPDGRRLYRTWLAFQSTEGQDAPAGVPANPSATPPQAEVPAGWIYAATTSALPSLLEVQAESRAL